MLISEELSGLEVARHEDGVVASPTDGTVEPFDDPLFDFILTAGLDEADYSTISEIARKFPFESVSSARHAFEQSPELPPRQWAENLAAEYLAGYGYGPDVNTTIRALFDLVANRVTRGHCHPAVGLDWLTSYGRFAEVGYHTEFQLTDELWTQSCWKRTTTST